MRSVLLHSAPRVRPTPRSRRVWAAAGLVVTLTAGLSALTTVPATLAPADSRAPAAATSAVSTAAAGRLGGPALTVDPHPDGGHPDGGHEQGTAVQLVSTTGPIEIPSAPVEPAPATTPTTAPDAAPTTPPDAAPTTPSDAGPDTPTTTTTGPQPENVEVTGVVVRAFVEAGRTDAQIAAGTTEFASVSVQLTWIEPVDGPSVQVPTSQLEQVPDGAVVRAVVATVPVPVGPDSSDGTGDHDEAGHVVRSLDVVSLPATATATADATAETTAADDGSVAAASTYAAHQVTVVQVVPAGMAPDGTSLQQVVNAVNGPVSSFWNEQTGGRISFTVAASRDWFYASSSCEDVANLWSEVAAAVGFDRSTGSRKNLLLYLPSSGYTPNCYAGLAQVTLSPDANGYAYVRGAQTSLIAHELGHNLGLGHTDALQCEYRTDAAYASGSFGSSCAVRGYGDWYDVMGVSWEWMGSVNAQHATFLGAMGAGDRLDVTGSVRTSLLPMSGLTGRRTLRLVDGGQTYWVEFRPPTGRDSFLKPGGNRQGLQSGVLLRRSNPDTYARNGSLLLDGTPGARSSWGTDWQETLPVGRTITLAGGRTTITVDSVETSTAVVSVVVDGVPPPTAPVVLSQPSAGSTSKGGWLVLNRLEAAPQQ